METHIENNSPNPENENTKSPEQNEPGTEPRSVRESSAVPQAGPGEDILGGDATDIRNIKASDISPGTGSTEEEEETGSAIPTSREMITNTGDDLENLKGDVDAATG